MVSLKIYVYFNTYLPFMFQILFQEVDKPLNL